MKNKRPKFRGIKISKRTSRVVSFVLAIFAVIVVSIMIFGDHNLNGSFLDLTNFARMVEATVAILFSGLSVLAWKVENKEQWKTKFIVWLVAVVIIIVIAVICSYYSVPATEIA